jgi:hypothetical protein
MKRSTLHINHLEPFKEWLVRQGIAYRPGKGNYQVLQVNTPEHGFQVIFSREDMPEHYTVAGKLLPLVMQFLNERKGETK